MTCRLRCFLLTLIVLLMYGAEAQAHRLGEGYLFLNIREEQISGRIELHLEDLDDALGLDRDSNGIVSRDELDAGIEPLREYVSPRVRLGSDSRWWAIRFNEHGVVSFPNGNFAQLYFVVDETGPIPDTLRIDYRLLFDHNENQRGLLVIEENARIGFRNQDEMVSMLFTSDEPVRTVDLTVAPPRNVFLVFVREGIWHIWIGLDHILFLVALLLPSVRDRLQPWWKPVDGFRPALWTVVKVVTLFTIAHSITLALAALKIVELPGPLVETIIAGSIVVAAVDNVVPIFAGRIGWIVFGFGLFHGLGFANVLGHLTLAPTSLLTTLFGFNLGVEIGQVAIICLVFPILYSLRRSSWYPNVIQRGVSVLLILLGLCWMVERTFDVTVLGL